MANSVANSKTEYLKRYLESEKKSKRKKKPKTSNTFVPRMKIIDKNIDVKAIIFGEEVEEDDDEAPLVAEVIDERPVELKMKEVYEASRWKKLDSASEDEGSHAKGSSQSPLKKRHDSDNDFSPPRKNSQTRQHSDSDCSPPRKSSQKQNRSTARHDSGSDNSPPPNCKENSTRKRRYNSDSDMSPPRKQAHRNSGQHSSQKLKIEAQNKAEKIKRKSRFDSDSDLSPERPKSRKQTSSQKSRGSDSDLSPPRKFSDKEKYNSRGEMMRPVKTLSGLKAGLQNAETLRKETQELKLREKKQIDELGAELSGRNAETIIRDKKTGRRRDLEEESHEKEEEKRRLSEQQKKYSEWGKGIEQSESRKNKFSEDLYEMSKPLARHHGDDDLEDMLKSKILAEDPMAEYMAKKRQKADVSRMPEYSGPPPPPNRFGVRPGYRWDGVDRSNGFEKKYFEKVNNTKAGQEEAYLWSVQDM